MYYRHNSKLTSNARNLRKNMTKQEKRLWYEYLKSYPIRFLRQKVVDNYILDFYCSKAQIAIELDGSQHYKKEIAYKDKIRTKQLEKYNITVYRIPNVEVDRNFEGVCIYIDKLINESLRRLTPPPPFHKGG